ncbi:cytochrome c oxidase subunit II [candidate division KSB1 bacterium]
MFTDASNFVKGVDTAFFFILGVSIFFLVGITAVMIYFVIRYNKKRNPKSSYIPGSITLEIIWTIIPVILVLIMFFYGWAGYAPMQKPPKDAINIKSIARMWNFKFEYENGKLTDTLYVPLNKAVKIDLIALDVIHSLYVPAFRIKEDMVPGKKNFLWFRAQKEGSFDLFCTEYCGLRHSYMNSMVVVLSEEEYNSWYEDTDMIAPGLTAEDIPESLDDQLVLEKFGCQACHSYDGTKLVGPSFKGLYGKKETVETNGIKREIIVDDEYITTSIYKPEVDIVDGYKKGQMITYKGLVSEQEAAAIVNFIKTLND